MNWKRWWHGAEAWSGAEALAALEALECLDDLEALEALDELEEVGAWGGKFFFEVKAAMGGLRWCRVTV